MTDITSRNAGKPNERHGFGWLLFPVSLFPLVALLTYDPHAIEALETPAHASTNWIGPLGDYFAYYGYTLFGFAVWIVPLICITRGIRIVLRRTPGPSRRLLWHLLILASAACLLQVAESHADGLRTLRENARLVCAGGAVGYLVMTRGLTQLLSDFGASVIALLGLIVATLASIGVRNIAAFFATLYRWVVLGRYNRETATATTDATDDTEESRADQERYLAALRARDAAKAQRDADKARIREEKEAERARVRAARAAARKNPDPPTAPAAPVEAEPAETTPGGKGPYILPSVSLLAPLKTAAADHSDVGTTSQRLIDTLKLFGVDATLSYTVQGPVVTKYAIMLAPGTRYSSVTNLQDNLKGALHAKSLRIEAPIPGEEAIGIEVPNLKPAGITFREIFESDAWRDAKAELPLLFGKRADGKELVADLATMPHLLVAGATGQGKSVCLNSLISGLLMTRTPEQLKLIMVDPKCVEFTPYAAIPHLLVPVITDNRKVVFSLHWAVAEMEKRLKLFARARVRNIYDFNRRMTLTQTDMFGRDTEIGSDIPRTVPYIVIIIDEAADLIGQCGKEVNPDIQRITQKARAAGIHLILATQRPDAKIITGAIKANIPGRVAFKTASAVDSRTILDDAGAENLIGRGDMLFRSKDGLLIRAQGAWISDSEIVSITSFIEQHSSVEFDEKFATKLGRVKEAVIEDPFASNEDDPDNQEKPAVEKQQERELVKAAANADDFKKAVECIINTKRASTSHFQRQMGWGYNHSAKIMDMLTERGIISPQQGMGPRTILLDQDQLMAIMNGGDATNQIADGAAPETAEPTGEDEPSDSEETDA
ncbi:MAG: DNA translocase FtsK 4TM domain-containing protein [Kiritimatiellia bacterium]